MARLKPVFKTCIELLGAFPAKKLRNTSMNKLLRYRNSHVKSPHELLLLTSELIEVISFSRAYAWISETDATSSHMTLSFRFSPNFLEIILPLKVTSTKKMMMSENVVFGAQFMYNCIWWKNHVRFFRCSILYLLNHSLDFRSCYVRVLVHKEEYIFE